MGNIREVWNGVRKNYYNQVKELASTRQRTQNYPSGLPWAESFGAAVQKNKFNGCEFIEMNGFDVTDLGNRGVQNATNRFTSMDRFCEKFPWQSPYVHAGNNPVNFVDVNGDSIWVSVVNQNTKTIDKYYWGTDSNGKQGFLDANKNLYTGNDQFVLDLTANITDLSSKSFGKSLVSDLSASTNNLTIAKSRDGENKADVNGTYILWEPKNTNGGISDGGGTSRPSFIGLGHEMAHIQDTWNKTIDNTTWVTIGSQTIPNSEKYATHVENQIRSEHNIPLRTHYGIQMVMGGIKMGLESTRIVFSGFSLFYKQYNCISPNGSLLPPIPFRY